MPWGLNQTALRAAACSCLHDSDVSTSNIDQASSNKDTYTVQAWNKARNAVFTIRIDQQELSALASHKVAMVDMILHASTGEVTGRSDSLRMSTCRVSVRLHIYARLSMAHTCIEDAGFKAEPVQVSLDPHRYVALTTGW